MLRKRLGILGLTLTMLLLLLGWISSLSASSDAAKPAAAPSGQQTITQLTPDELEPSIRNGNQRISTATGQPLVLYAVNYVVAPGAPEDMARQYLRENAALLHLQAPDLRDLAHTFTRQGPSGPTVRFRQVVNGIPVYKSDVVVHLNNKHIVTYVANDYKSALVVPANMNPSLTAVDATQIVRDYLGITGKTQLEKSDLMLYVLQGQTYLVYRVNIVANDPLGDWEALVDANTGEFLKLVNQSMDYGEEGEGGAAVSSSILVTGTGNVFDPDPLSSATATYGDPGFTDNNDATSPQLDGELMSVTLQDITFNGGMYHLDGTYAAIRDTESPFKGLFSQATNVWNYNRFDDAFEAANTYYHIDSSMRYLNETLGLNIMPYQYSGGVRFDPHGLNGADNSHYSTGSGEVAFGEGGVDDAEDSDVIHHELGHGLHDWVTNGGLSQVNGLSEGTGDYWAQSYNRSLGYWQPGDPPYQWVFNWDGHNPFWNGRVTNYPALYPGGLTGQIHTDGQIWSTCNMRVYDEIGKQQMDRAFWEGLGMTNSSTNQEDAANAVYQAAIDMGYSAAELQDMHDIYLTCVYVVPDVPLADFDVVVTPNTLSVCSPNDAIFDVDVTQFNGFGTAVTLSASGQPDPPNMAVFSANNQIPPFSSTLTIGTNGAATGAYDIDVSGMAPTTTHTTTVQLVVADSVPGAPTLLTPADGETDVP
ncbi:MAG: PepSY domain-containing protein, partial [Anaerolineae bacterium]|nr:PepSY domain-containing protein [Anaerolineae bacterium]